MKTIGRLTTVVGALGFALGAFCVSPAAAQATRTWVSGVGDDANPCSRTAPCKTFAGAISKTATAGEINCLDPGGFGGVTITKALSIVCDYTEGGILSAGAGVNGIVVNAPATADVYLSGLDLHGAGNAQNGIRFIAGRALHIQNSVIRFYNAANSLGISFQPSAASRLYIDNTTVAHNGSAGGTGGGILIKPTGTGSAIATLTNVRVQNNATHGLMIDTTGNTGPGVFVAVDDGVFAGSTHGVRLLVPTSSANLSIINSTVMNNSSTGILASGSAASVRASNNTITDNTLGVSAINTAFLATYLDNRMDRNATDGTFTSTLMRK